MPHRHRNGKAEATPAEWREFREHADVHRRALERIVRRTMIHDDRAVSARVDNVSARDVADEAICWALSEWRGKPSSVTPEQWARKHALLILDAALDREALAAEGRAEERRVEHQLRAGESLADDDDRAEWLDLVAPREGDREPLDDFESLTSDPELSSAETRFSDAERVAEVSRALRRLPELRRRVVTLRILDGLPAEDVAYLLDIETADVGRELADALRSLRLELAETAGTGLRT